MRGVQDTARRLRLLVECSPSGVCRRKLTVFCSVNGLDPFVSFLDHNLQFLLPGLQLGADVSPLGVEIENLLLESLDLPLFDLVCSRDVQGAGNLCITFDE